MIFNSLGEAVLRSPALLSASILLIIAYSIHLLLTRPKKLNLPIVGKPGEKSWKDALIEGNRKYPDTPFVIPESPPLVILPISVLNEVGTLPENQASLTKDVYKMFLGKYTGIGTIADDTTQAIKVDLTRHIAKTLDGLQDEIRYSFNKELGPCEDWTPFVLYQKLTRIVALLSGRVFVGHPLSREEEWIDLTINYTTDSIGVFHAIQKYPSYIRPIVAPFLPEIRRVRHHLALAGKLMEPLIKGSLAKANGKKGGLEPNDDQGTFISWVLKHTKADREDPMRLGRNQMVVSFAAIHTTTMAVSQAIFDMAARPEYIQPLRDEIDQVLQEDGQDVDGDEFVKLKKASLTKLRKMDSFLKESQRLSPPIFTSVSRIATAPLTLSTGHTLPTGTRFAFNSYTVHTDPSTTTFSPAYNPASNPAPTEFYGFRFYNLRNMEGKENRHQFVTVSPDSLIFGYGNHACPGRFFASNEIKIVLIELLRSWDFRLKGDIEGTGGKEKRPENWIMGMSCVPNQCAEIEFRRRREG